MSFDPDRHLYQPHASGPDDAAPRVRWSPASADLNVNLVHLRRGEVIEPHANDLLDVLITILDGSGHLSIDDESLELAPGVIVLVPKGTVRGVTAGERGLVYTTCHRAKQGLMPGPPRR